VIFLSQLDVFAVFLPIVPERKQRFTLEATTIKPLNPKLG
jgi:hypothetical protein